MENASLDDLIMCFKTPFHLHTDASTIIPATFGDFSSWVSNHYHEWWSSISKDYYMEGFELLANMAESHPQLRVLKNAWGEYHGKSPKQKNYDTNAI